MIVLKVESTKAMQQRDALAFACLLHRLQQKLCINIDSDIIKYMYDIYLIDYYDKYTLFELIDMLYTRHIAISCELNKKALIKMIKSQRLNIPDRTWFDKKGYTEWCQHTYGWGSHLYLNNIPKGSCRNVVCIKKIYADIEISKDDVYKIDNTYYELLAILHGKIFIYKTEETNICSNVYLDIGKFVKMIDEGDTTIIHNSVLRIKNI